MMLRTKYKRRAPMAQLRAASKVANEMLVGRRILASEGILKRLSKLPYPPKLPGVPAYLPRPYTLDWARVVMTIVLKKWLTATKDDEGKVEDVRSFMVFAVRRIEDEERKWTFKMRSTNLEEVKDETLAQIFLPMQARETAEKLKTFMVDMFNKSAVVSQNGTVSELVEEFDKDTLKMKELWLAEDKRVLLKLPELRKGRKRGVTKTLKTKKRANDVHKK